VRRGDNIEWVESTLVGGRKPPLFTVKYGSKPHFLSKVQKGKSRPGATKVKRARAAERDIPPDRWGKGGSFKPHGCGGGIECWERGTDGTDACNRGGKE